MKVAQTNIYEILKDGNQFQIPVYQRHYSWNETHCTCLWNDIVEMNQRNKTSHFIGSIVNIFEPNGPSDVRQFTIIDGQQRITTLMLLLIALRDYAIEHPEDKSINYSNIDNKHIKNQSYRGNKHYKLLLIGQDDVVFKNIVERIHIDLSLKKL